MISLRDDALAKMRAGLTSADEVLRRVPLEEEELSTLDETSELGL
jgi:hypothetical protein